jgi:hypothetical protein
MIGRGIVQGTVDGCKVAVQVFSIKQDFSGSVIVRYQTPGTLLPVERVFTSAEWNDLTVPEFLGRIAKWNVN